MKSLSLFVVLICIFNGVWALNVWPEPVMMQETDYYSSNNASVNLETSSVTVWSDYRSGHQSLYAQRISETGEKLWTPEGVKLAETNLNQRNHRVIVSSDGGIIVVWKEYQIISNNQEPNYLMAQKLDMNGNRLWTISGKMVYNSETPVYKFPTIRPDQNGGFYMTEFLSVPWNNNSNVVHVDSNGNIVHSFAFEFAEAENNGQLIKAIYHSGNYYIAVYVESGTYKMAKFNNQGSCLTTPLVLSPVNSGNMILKQIDETRTLFLWTSDNSIKAQIITGNGNGLLADQGRTLFSGSPEPFVLQHESALDCSLLLFKWGYSNGYYIIRLDSNFNATNIVNTQIVDGDLFSMYLTPVEKDCYIFWKDTNYSLRGQKYSNSFQKLWGEEGRVLEPHFYAKAYHTTRLSDNHFAFIWDDLYRDQISCHFLNQDVMTLENEPTSIYQGIISKWTGGKKLVSTQNKSFIVWENTNPESKKVYLQITDNANGQVMWPQTAKRLSSRSHFSSIVNAKLNLQNRLVVWWLEKNNNETRMKIQVVEPNGNFLYPEEGLVIVNLPYYYDVSLFDKSSIQFEGDRAFFYFFDYDENNLFDIIRGQCVHNGNLMWGEQGRMIVHKALDPDMFSPDNIACKIVDNDTQENMIFWIQGSGNDSKVYMLRLNSEGQPADNQNPEGTPVFYNYMGISGVTKINVVKQGDEYIIYDRQAAYQIISADGSLLLPLDKCLVNDDSNLREAYWNNGFITYSNGDGTWYKDILHRQNNDFISILNNPAQVSMPANFDIYNHFEFLPMHNRTLMVYNTDNALFMNVNGLNEEYLAEPYSISENPNLHYHYLTLEKINNSDALINWIEYISNDETNEFVKNHYLQRISVSSFTDTDNLVTLPAPAILKQNYPNPFNPSTKICYTLKNPGPAELSVYNIKGQKVATLVNTEMTAGNHEVVWNGKDENGVGVSSGIYFYRLESGSVSLTKKMILMK